MDLAVMESSAGVPRHHQVPVGGHPALYGGQPRGGRGRAAEDGEGVAVSSSLTHVFDLTMPLSSGGAAMSQEPQRTGRADRFPLGSQVQILHGEYVGQCGTVVAQRNEWGLYVVVDGHLLRSISDQRLQVIEPSTPADAKLRSDLQQLLKTAYTADQQRPRQPGHTGQGVR